MQAPRRSARNAEREFLDSIRELDEAVTPLAQARSVQQRIDDARIFRLPLPDVREVPFAELTPRERDSFFGAFDDTQPIDLA